MAYSAVTTCSFQNARIAADCRDYVTSIDTKAATFAQGTIVLGVAQFLERNTDCSLEKVLDTVNCLCQSCCMCFFPGDLLYLKAGGRLTNAAYVGAKILSLNPKIEMRDGKLITTKKYRGKIERNALRLLEDFAEEKKPDRRLIVFGYSPGLKQEIRNTVTRKAREMGFENIRWVQTGCVVSVHGGSGGIRGLRLFKRSAGQAELIFQKQY